MDEIDCQVLGGGRLYRKFELTVNGWSRVLEYVGNGRGFEEVRIDGDPVCKERTWLWWAPRFEFDLAGRRGVFEVRVGPFLAIRAARLSVDGEPVYAEGKWSDV